MFKKVLVLFSFIFASIVLCVACEKSASKKESFIETTAADIYDFDRNYSKRKVGVVYFSTTGNTKAVAEKLAEIVDADMVEIKSKEEYTTTDLTSYDSSTRPQKEKEEKSFPEIAKVNVKNYDTIFLGYPIWYGDAPRVIYTFIKDNNLDKKVVIPFCTSDNSAISPSDNNLAEYGYEIYEDVSFMGGKRFAKGTTIDEIKEWVISIGPDLDY